MLFAREGADVAIAYLNEDMDAEETKRAVENEGRRCILLPGDVADPAYCRSAVKKTIDVFGKLDILVNNAAFQEHANKLEDISDEHFDRTIKTNLYGYFNMAKAAVPKMKKGGSIVMTGSVTGLFGNKHLLDYSLTKGGIHAFARSLASQLVDRGIRVNVVAPGPVWTPLNPADKPASWSRHSAVTRRWAGRRSLRRSRLLLCFSLRLVARATSPAKSCRSSAAIRVVEGEPRPSNKRRAAKSGPTKLLS